MNEEMNNNNYNSTPNYNYEKKNNGVKVLLIVLIILVLCLIGLLSYKIFIVDKKNDNKESSNTNNNIVEKVDNDTNNTISDDNSKKVNDKEEKDSNIEEILLSDNDKIKINKMLNDDFSYFLSYDNSESKFDFSGNVFNDYDKTFLFTKYNMNSKGKVQVATGMDEEGNILGNTYSKCNEGTGSASIKENDFNVYYKNLFGKEFDKTKFDSKMFVDGYICTSMPSGYTATQIPVLKVASKTFNKSLNEYTLNITVLSNLVDASEYSDASVLTWPKEAETSHLELKYKENKVTDYQIISLSLK